MKNLVTIAVGLFLAASVYTSTAKAEYPPYVQMGNYSTNGAYQHVTYPSFPSGPSYSSAPAYYLPSVASYAPRQVTDFAVGPYKHFESYGGYREGTFGGSFASQKTHDWRTGGYYGPMGHGSYYDESTTNSYRGYGFPR